MVEKPSELGQEYAATALDPYVEGNELKVVMQLSAAALCIAEGLGANFGA